MLIMTRQPGSCLGIGGRQVRISRRPSCHSVVIQDFGDGDGVARLRGVYRRGWVGGDQSDAFGEPWEAEYVHAPWLQPSSAYLHHSVS